MRSATLERSEGKPLKKGCPSRFWLQHLLAGLFNLSVLKAWGRTAPLANDRDGCSDNEAMSVNGLEQGSSSKHPLLTSFYVFHGSWREARQTGPLYRAARQSKAVLVCVALWGKKCLRCYIAAKQGSREMLRWTPRPCRTLDVLEHKQDISDHRLMTQARVGKLERGSHTSQH